MATNRKPHKLRSFTIDRDELFHTIHEWYTQDVYDRALWSERRLQRYAKYRGWLEPKRWPWPGASNTQVPLLMTDVQRATDTLVNGVIGSRPVMSPEAVHEKDQPKEDAIEHLLDYQIFVRQPGEEKIQEVADSFLVDGRFVVHTPWVRDRRKVEQVQQVDAPTPGMEELPYFQSVLSQLFAETTPIVKDEKNPYKWTLLSDDKDIDAEFAYDENDHLLLTTSQDKLVFDGPLLIHKSLEDVVVPARSDNLQIPGPSNPGGAHHVMIVDYPSKDEIVRLYKQKYYDLMTKEDLDKLEGTERGLGTSYDPETHKVQKDQLAGQTYGVGASAENTYTRLICYGPWDVDDDGLDEQCVFWVLLEPRIIMRARYLSEVFPSDTPRRPFASAALFPVPGEFYGISYLELLEHLHDLMKVLIDQSLDAHTLANTPFFFYRASSGVRPEVIRMQPGDGYPVNDPVNDIAFPTLPQINQAGAINFLTLVNQWAERQAVIGELQFGRVPQGKASALRTASATQTILQQGDARPERILRRFFKGLSQIWENFHLLNQAFLKGGEEFKVSNAKPHENPYRRLDNPSQIRGDFQFDFKANVLNTNKALFSQIMQQVMQGLLNPLALQMGLVTPDKVYNILEDFIRSLGQTPTRYLNAPPQVDVPQFSLDDVLGLILAGELPQGQPAGGAIHQLQQLHKMMNETVPDERILLIQLDPGKQQLLQAFMNQLQQLAMMEQRQMQMEQAAQQFQQGLGVGPGGGFGGHEGGGPGDPNNPMLQQGELLDETMPGGGGGAFQGAGQS